VVGRIILVLLLVPLLIASGCVPQDVPVPAASPSPQFPLVTRPTATPSPSPEHTPTPTPPAWLAQQQMAMTREARSDLLALEDLTRYDIDLTIGVESLVLTGRQTTEYTNNSGEPLPELYFNLFPNSSRFAASMEISSLSIEGKEQQFEYQRNGTVVRVALPEPLDPGQTTTVAMDFTARVPHVQKNYYLVFAMAQGVLSLGDWHPMVAVYDDQGWNLDYPEGTVGEIVFSESAFYTVRVTLPSGPALDVVATGVESEHTLNGDGSETWLYHSGPVRDFHLVVTDRYGVATSEVGETTINSYYWPEHEVCGREALASAGRALTLYSDLFAPYPFTELDLAEADLWPWAIEWPGLILVGAPLYSDPEEECGEWHVVHEVAHQWWYSVVGNDQVDEPWLDEALANYSTALYYEWTRDPQEAAATIAEHIDERYEAYVQAYGDGIVGGPTSAYTRASYYPLVYGKGALFFAALRREIGDDAFFQGLRGYYERYKYRVGTAEGLRRAMETAYGHPLDEFFQHWIYSAAGT
jgi:aminopeptidase N